MGYSAGSSFSDSKMVNLPAVNEGEAPAAKGLSSAVLQAFSTFEDLIQRHQVVVLLLFSIAFCLSGFASAARKPLWFDELATYIPAQLPSWGDVFRYYSDGGDVHTPFASALVRLCLALPGAPEIKARAPMILGFLLACLSIFGILAKRTNALYALAAVLILACTRARYYATELRPYGILLGLSALAILCWLEYRERPRVYWLAALGAALGSATLLHVFGAFVCLPILIAEVARWREKRLISWQVPVVLVLSVIPSMFFLPGIFRASRMLYQPHWPHPNLVTLLGAYQVYLALPMAGICFAIGAWVILRWVLPPAQQRPVTLAAIPEQLLVVTLACLPIVAVISSIILKTGSFNDRYVLYSLNAIVILGVYVAYAATRGNSLFGVCLVVLFGFQFSGGAVRDVLSLRGAPPKTAIISAPWITEASVRKLPLVVQSWKVYPQIQFYGDPALARNTYFLLQDRQPDGRIYSDDFCIDSWAKRFGWPTIGFREFAKTNRHFLFYYDSSAISLPITAILPPTAKLTPLIQCEEGPLLLDVTL